MLAERGFIKGPSFEKEWVEILDQLKRKLNSGNWIGVIDGKHVLMQAYLRYGLFFFNYKKTHSIILMAVVNSNYQFTMVIYRIEINNIELRMVVQNCSL